MPHPALADSAFPARQFLLLVSHDGRCRQFQRHVKIASSESSGPNCVQREPLSARRSGALAVDAVATRRRRKGRSDYHRSAMWNRFVLAAVFSFVSVGKVAFAKPLVYCADASPEGFDPSLWDSTSTRVPRSESGEGQVSLFFMFH
jgi:hypothetical protein